MVRKTDKRCGVLASQQIEELIKNGKISAGKEIPPDNIQPASLDLRIAAGEIVRLPGIFLPKCDDVFDYAKKLSAKSHLEYNAEIGKEGFMLEVDIPYLIPVEESLNLDENICCYSNNKSSSGRLNLQVRLVCNNNQEFDYIPKGYKGKLYLIVVAKSFPIHITPGEKLNQIRFFENSIGNSKVHHDELESIHNDHGLVFDRDGSKMNWGDLRRIHSSIVLTADLETNDIVSYRYKGTATNGLWYKDRGLDYGDYFEEIERPEKDGYIVLSKGRFYILSTREAFRVPPMYCSEMVAYSTGIGEYRSHFAGFFDPGWGCNREREGGAAVLEIIPHEDILLYHGQPVCVMDMYKMLEEPKTLYGQNGSNYHDQDGPRLGKQFSQPDNK